MKLEDAPPAGWYPDPQGASRLRWWEGTDWTDDYRAPPSTAELDKVARALDTIEMPAESLPPRGARIDRQQADQIVTQVRDTAREEAARAADLFTQRAREALDRGRSVVGDYIGTVLRWVRILVVVAAVAVIAWFVLQFIAQATFLEWIGDRIDNIVDS